MASIGAIALPVQGAGRGAEALGLSGTDGEVHHRPDRDVTVSAPKSVSLMTLIGGDERIVAAHDRAVRTTLGWIEKNAVLTRLHGDWGAMVRAEGIELRAGDRIHWTRNHAGLGLMNSGTAEVASVQGGRVSFRLEDGRTLDLWKPDLQLRYLDHAWAAAVHGFQGRTVDNVIAVMEANHPHLTTRKSFVEISRVRHKAELVTDDAKALSERVAALEAVKPAVDKSVAKEDGKHRNIALEAERTVDKSNADPGWDAAKETSEPPQREPEQEKVREFKMEM